MRNFLIWVIVILWLVFLFRSTFWTWDPVIYTNLQHEKNQLLDSVENLKNVTREGRMIALSDGIVAKLIKIMLPKLNQVHYDYYYVVDYAIDHDQKDRMLSSMNLNERYEFKQNPVTWDVLKGATRTLSPAISQGLWIEILDKLEEQILTE